MDSPISQASSQLQRMRTHSNLSVHSIDNRGAIRKRTPSLSRSVSTSQADRLYQYALEQSNAAESCGVSLTSAPHWLTPQSSPQPHIFPDSQLEPFPQWSVPTPPRSDSGLPTVSIDADEVPVTTSMSPNPDFTTYHQQPTTAAEMSSLGFLLPSQYGSGPLEAEPGSYNMEQNYIPPPRMSQPTSTSATAAYAQAQTSSSSPALYQSRSAPQTQPNFRRYSDLPGSNTPEPYASTYRRTNSSYDSGSNIDYSMVSGPSIPSISGLVQSPQSSPHLGSNASGMMPQYTSNPSRSPSMYETSMYGQPFTSAPTSTPIYGQSLSYPPPFVGSSVNEVLAKPLGSDSSIRVLNQRPKPQCWEHGCNGRQFSTFSNLLRHQREKSGSASKSYCPKCGAEFTRTTARNGHLAHDKCTKTRRPSDPQ